MTIEAQAKKNGFLKKTCILNLFKFEYIDQLLPWKEMKETFSVKALNIEGSRLLGNLTK